MTLRFSLTRQDDVIENTPYGPEVAFIHHVEVLDAVNSARVVAYMQGIEEALHYRYYVSVWDTHGYDDTDYHHEWEIIDTVLLENPGALDRIGGYDEDAQS